MEKQNNQTEVEIWIPCLFIRQDGTVEIFPNYEVSNLGKIRSLNYNHTGKPRVMKPGAIVQSNGTYYQINLFKGNKRYTRKVHRLVLSSFDSKGYFKDAVCDHIDSNPSNNRLNNLRWITQQENVSTSHYKALQINRSDLSKRVKVTFLSVGHYEIFPSMHEAERSLGLPKGTVTPCMSQHNSFYKKLNLLFEYI